VAKYKLYGSNLAWKARSNNLKEFFLQYNPVSANVVFDDKKSAGYGFVSFGTKEEAESALSELDGKVIILETLTYQFYSSHQGLRLIIH
jgi:RNA recognition motif-containing protein